jgi:uncharacterized protein (TIGR02246 family)
MTATHPLRDFAERYTAAWCSQDPARVASFYAPEGSLAVNDGAAAVGRDAIQAIAQSFMTAFPNLEVLLDEIRDAGGHTEYHWTLIGTYAETDRPVRISGYEVWTISGDGLIAQSQGHFDGSDYQRQIGV